MEIYPAIGFHQILENGGSTYPWLVNLMLDRNDIRAFVVKMFTVKQCTQQHAVAKEVYGNVLASALSLSVPRMGFAEFGDDFLDTLTNDHRKIFAERHLGIKFSTEYHEDFTIFGHTLARSKITEYDLPSVYAFDNLVWNLDRGHRNKPNFLIKDDEYLLIDHEMIFPFANDDPNYKIVDEFLAGRSLYSYRNHIFYAYLKKLRQDKKSGIFDHFLKSLQRLDPFILNDAAEFLQNHGHTTASIEFIIDYLDTVKKNPDKFLRILQLQIS